MVKAHTLHRREPATPTQKIDPAKIEVLVCWNCNPDNKAYKKVAIPFLCYRCGTKYLNGKRITEEEVGE
jgi:hypothetical protein